MSIGLANLNRPSDWTHFRISADCRFNVTIGNELQITKLVLLKTPYTDIQCNNKSSSNCVASRDYNLRVERRGTESHSQDVEDYSKRSHSDRY